MIERLLQTTGYRGYGVLNEYGAYIEGSYNNDLGSSLGKSIFELKSIIEGSIGPFQITTIRGRDGAIFIACNQNKTYFVHTLRETNYGLVRKILLELVKR
ncbi:hypothetical protein DRP53_02225 [candidate division WOR-3 bacterium]|uniref:Roadblock/LAMTOR2 domain-containing protein n=1 Tax=candidate division WOR-3 bacterium TaxID=2052148 RepID=A0A660SMB8_UNCW3|nr:MAG: hypothetical protein DRP53_02225 [candidate division WOR-3 bacterium]